VPNALLEALGAGRFPGPGDQVVVCGATPPLTIITTNEERALPDAFLRRCLVLHLAWPKDEGKLKKDLVIWGRAHFAKASQDLLEKAADLLIIDRRAVAGRGLNPPGGAEYLDLLRAVLNQVDDPAGQKALLDVIAGFALRKHPQEGAD
jgi:MoxR-like ATPase